MKKEFLEIGKIVGTHGVRGMVRIQPWCDGIEFLKGVKTFYAARNGGSPLKCERISENGNVFIAKFSGVDSIDSAEAFRGTVLNINRNDVKLEEGRYFIEDLIGAVVLDAEEKTEYGVISDVSATGANDVWHIKKGDKEYLIPVIKDVVKKVDIDSGIVEITPLKGIFDDED